MNDNIKNAKWFDAGEFTKTRTLNDKHKAEYEALGLPCEIIRPDYDTSFVTVVRFKDGKTLSPGKDFITGLYDNERFAKLAESANAYHALVEENERLREYIKESIKTYPPESLKHIRATKLLNETETNDN